MMTSVLHTNTPTLQAIDSRSLSIATVRYYRQSGFEVQACVERQMHNVVGQLIHQWDARLWERGEVNETTVHSLSNLPLCIDSVDAGWRVKLFGDGGQTIEEWDERNLHRVTQYDNQLRPLGVREWSEEGPQRCVECFTYGDSSQNVTNRCGQLIRYDDTSGTLSLLDNGLSGQPLAQTKQFLAKLGCPDWPQAMASRSALLEHDGKGTPVHYTTRWQQDALGGMLSQTDALGNTQYFRYDMTGQLFSCRLKRANCISPITIIQEVMYNVFAQVEGETLSNGVKVTTTYSSDEGRLQQSRVVRGQKVLQELSYCYDPVGNILSITDGAQPTDWFDGEQVDPLTRYEYDTLYRLIEAKGRESVLAGIQPSLPGLIVPGGGDANRRRNYTQTYSYDVGGNLLAIKHNQRPVRTMRVDMHSNRSLYQADPANPPDLDAGFDANGNLLCLEGVQSICWDARNRLQRVTQIVRPDGVNDAEEYEYSGRGQRQRKVRVRQAKEVTHLTEVRYLPGLEISHNMATDEALETMVVQAGGHCVRCLQWQAGGIALPELRWRYALADHLGSVSLELDDQGNVISHEGYYPFGGTAWWAARSEIDAEFKTIRYSGKERDATGLYYFGFRYYAPWLHRWISPDPAGNIDGLNLFRMVMNNPVRYSDVDGLIPQEANDKNTPAQNEPESSTEAETANVVPLRSNSTVGLAGDDMIKTFYRVDVSPPSEILKHGFHGNNTPRIIKLFGGDTIFVAQDLSGVDNFRKEVSSAENLFGDARAYYFTQGVNASGYVVEVQKTLYLYKISLPREQSYQVLSDFFAGDYPIESVIAASHGEDELTAYKAQGAEIYEDYLSQYKGAITAYSENFTVTREAQIKGPILPENITHITPAQEIFLRGQTVIKTAA